MLFVISIRRINWAGNKNKSDDALLWSVGEAIGSKIISTA
jgi:hypothetical protein